jgi:hypothetical protein
MRSATFPRLGLLSGAVLLLAGCGGSGPGGGGPTTVVLLTLPADDGYITSDGLVVDDSMIRAGDNAANESRRGFARFSLASVPSGATIVSAVLQLRQAGVTGDPYGSFGNVLVQHVDFGPAVDATDFNSALIGLTPGALSTDATLGTKTIDVTARVSADVVAGRAQSDFRFKFSSATTVTADGLSDSALFTEAGSIPGAPNAPQIVVIYQN